MHGTTSRSLHLARAGLLFTLLVGSVFLLSVVRAASNDSYKLSTDGPLPIGGDVVDFKIGPDSTLAVYRAGQEVAEIQQLYAVPTDRSVAPLKVSALPDFGHQVRDYAIGPNSAYVVYNADQDTQFLYELYSTPLDGSAPPEKISGEMVENGGLRDGSGSFKISPDGSRAIYRAQQDTDEVYELYSVPVDGSAPEVKLNADLPEGGFVLSYEITPDGQYVVYNADQETDNAVELFRVPIDGSAEPVKLSEDLVAGRTVSSFKISPDNKYVVYTANQDTVDVIELYMVPLDRSAMPIKLNGMLVADGDVRTGRSLSISPDSTWVTYIADQDTNNVDELYSVPIVGGQAVRLNTPLIPGRGVSTVDEPQISADSSRVVYMADQDIGNREELYSVPIAGGVLPIKLNGMLAGNFISEFEISPDGSRVVYRAREDEPTRFELYSVPLAGGMSEKLNGPLAADGEVNSFLIGADSSDVIFNADQGTDTANEIYRVPLAGGAAVRVSDDLIAGGSVFRYDVTPDSSHVLYIADQDQIDVNEFYQVPLAPTGLNLYSLTASLKLNDMLAIGADVWSFEITFDSKYVFYLADHNRLNRNDLYRARLDMGGDPVRMSQGLVGDYDVEDLEVTPDDSRVLFSARTTGLPDALYSMPVAGGAAPVQLNTSIHPSGDIHYFLLSEDSKYAVYRARQELPGIHEAYSAPVDGSGTQEKLNGSLVAGGEVELIRISPDSQRVVYTADQENLDIVELYSVPIGGGQAIKLSAPLLPGREIVSNFFTISPDSQWVGYLADHENDDVFELYLAPIGGGADPVKVNDPLVMDGDVLWFEFSPSGDFLVYYADQDENDQFEIYGVSLPGPGEPDKLNAPLGPGFNVGFFTFTPDSAYLIYSAGEGVIPDLAAERSRLDVAFAANSADVQQQDEYKFYSVSLPEGEPVELDIGLNPGEIMDFFDFSPDSSRMVYFVTSAEFPDILAQSSSGALYSIPSDGSGKPQPIGDPLADSEVIEDFWITADSERVIYGLEDDASVFTVFSAFIDGSGTPGKFTIPLVEGGSIDRARVSPDDSRLVYQADQDIIEVKELYATTLPAPIPPAPSTDHQLFLPIVSKPAP